MNVRDSMILGPHLLLVLRVESEVSPRNHLPRGHHPLDRLLFSLLLHQLVVLIKLNKGSAAKHVRSTRKKREGSTTDRNVASRT